MVPAIDMVRVVDSEFITQTIGESDLEFSIGMNDDMILHTGTRFGHQIVIVEVARPGAQGVVVLPAGFND